MSRGLQNLAAVALAGLWGLGIFVAHAQGRLSALDRAEAAMAGFRLLLRGVRMPPDLVTIVEIDDSTVKQLGSSYPLARLDLAGIVDAVARLKPKVIAVDLLLLDKGSGDGDVALARSLSAVPTVIAGAAVFLQSSQAVSIPDDKGPLSGLPKAEKFLLPLKTFTAQAQVGIVNVTTDQTGTPRAIPMLFRTDDGLAMSFPLRVAALAAGAEPSIGPERLVLGPLSIPTDADHALPIAFYGPRRTIRTIGAGSVLAGEAARDAIQDKIVVIGSTETVGGDFFPTPFEPLLPGVEVMATAITHLIVGDVVLRDRSVRLVDGVVCVLLPMMLVAFLTWRRSAAGLIATAALVLIWMSATQLAFSSGIWLSAVLPIAAAAPPAVLFGAVQLLSGRRRAQYFAMKSQLLEQFQAPVIQQWLTKNPNFLAEPVRQNAAIVFIDLSGFTSLSEALGPDRVRELLKEFHALVDREVVSCGGMITSFLGDGAMILFGLPAAASNDAVKAADCAVRLCLGAARWLLSLPRPVASQLGCKVGAHFGIIVASRLGGMSHHHITATGDTVNVASRLMEVAAHHGAELAVSDELLRAAGRDCALFERGELTGPRETAIRGRSGSLAVWLWRGNPSKHAQDSEGSPGP
ncbi:adenylate/guanylate cyclase domain-containing protein [Bradyrhizobium sp.]|jgi:adenylate cyclase|uniref:CHASE2 domain-containing protein n=1 Tax=Bradyrhizobium sp. TaxID=376 RepID=UPI002CFE3F84|nr:adenylate/guanylate cyclase domain-containing protein [Bradyrhizobium sp.]HWX59326.1 adenylate/guanylate cyclase domain-containing protein [Bradyrhizobium sp.]